MNRRVIRNAWWFLICEGEIFLLSKNNSIPEGNSLDGLISDFKSATKIAEYQDAPCYLIEVEKPIKTELGHFVELRTILGLVDEALFNIAGRACQLSLFYKTHKFCGKCGNKNTNVELQTAMKCTKCNFVCYPRISPCVIVAIRKKGQILLALHQRHKDFTPPIYTVLAGFIEAGESPEECVKREVMEESGIKIKNVQYIASQPWPFPHSLMMGFIAEYESGTINVQEEELCEANWYNFKNLPNLPNKNTLAMKLIEKTKTICTL